MGSMEEGRNRVLAIVAGILVARHFRTADDLFGGPVDHRAVRGLTQWLLRLFTLVDVEHGKRNVSILNLELIAKGFKVSVAQLFSRL